MGHSHTHTVTHTHTHTHTHTKSSLSHKNLYFQSTFEFGDHIRHFVGRYSLYNAKLLQFLNAELLYKNVYRLISSHLVVVVVNLDYTDTSCLIIYAYLVDIAANITNAFISH